MEEAGVILGGSAADVGRHLAGGRLDPQLSRVDVERLASEIFSWRRHADDEHPYWVTGRRAADLLGVSRSRLGQLADTHSVPYVRHQDGTRLYRRQDLTAIKHARHTRTAS
jgi:hypothetical protein